MSYEEETRNRYRDPSSAREYQSGYDNLYSFKNLRAQIVKYFEVTTILNAVLKTTPGGRVLDIPCGTGKLTNILIDKSFNYYGFDVSLDMINEISKPDSAKFINGDCSLLPFKNLSFDSIISLRLIHRLPGNIKANFFNEMARVARKDIVFSFTGDSTFSRVTLKLKRILNIVPEVIILDDITEYRAILENEGFTFVRAEPIFFGFSNQYIYHFSRKES